ncbi:MAG: YHS domain protein [Gammaproteobacteria bacterium]|nr:YHS domain protein [Gammaproteobacteria bacterium]
MNISKFLLAASLVTLPIVGMTAQAAPAQPLQERFDTLGLGVAIGGFDPVAYFPEGGGKPAKGFVKRDFKHGGVTYRFASDANRERFRTNPEKYVPAYNGWCAWAMAELNAKVDVEPTSYEIYEGKLYVFYDHADLNTRELWLKDPAAMVTRADANWKAQSK